MMATQHDRYQIYVDQTIESDFLDLVDRFPLPTTITRESRNPIAQVEPHHICQRGYYSRTCNDPKCSLACHARWSYKISEVVYRFLKDKPLVLFVDFKQKSMDLKDHRRYRRSFFSKLRYIEKKRSQTLRVLLVPHATDEFSFHYDALVYTDMNVDDAKEALKHSWNGKVAGAPVRSLIASCKYVVKNCKTFHLLLARHGLYSLYGQKHFFAGKSIDELWKERNKEVHGTNKPVAAKQRQALPNEVTSTARPVFVKRGRLIMTLSPTDRKFQVVHRLHA